MTSYLAAYQIVEKISLVKEQVISLLTTEFDAIRPEDIGALHDQLLRLESITMHFDKGYDAQYPIAFRDFDQVIESFRAFSKNALKHQTGHFTINSQPAVIPDLQEWGDVSIQSVWAWVISEIETKGLGLPFLSHKEYLEKAKNLQFPFALNEIQSLDHFIKETLQEFKTSEEPSLEERLSLQAHFLKKFPLWEKQPNLAAGSDLKKAILEELQDSDSLVFNNPKAKNFENDLKEAIINRKRIQEFPYLYLIYTFLTSNWAPVQVKLVNQFPDIFCSKLSDSPTIKPQHDRVFIQYNVNIDKDNETFSMEKKIPYGLYANKDTEEESGTMYFSWTISGSFKMPQFEADLKGLPFSRTQKYS